MFRIYGTTGEYSDFQEWTVGVTRYKENAIKICQKYNDWCRENYVHTSNYDYKYRSNIIFKCPFDPFFSLDTTGVSYEWEEIADLDEVENNEQVVYGRTSNLLGAFRFRWFDFINISGYFITKIPQYFRAEFKIFFDCLICF